MAEPRRGPVLALGVALVICGAVLGTGASSGAGGQAPGLGVEALGTVTPSQVPVQALSTSWSCGGATAAPGSVAPGELLVENAGDTSLQGVVRLVLSAGPAHTVAVSVPPGRTATVPEQVAGAGPHDWVAAEVTLYGGMASVLQVVETKYGNTSQPCASEASSNWYFADGMTLRNAAEELSLVNPYPVDAIVDLSFTTDLGREVPGDYQGVVVPAHGMTAINLGVHLRRRLHVAATVQVRSGQVVAFETELVSKPPKGAPSVEAPGALNPVSVQAGALVTLGAPQPASSLWWPSGADGPGVTETYDVYNPGAHVAHLSLQLITQGKAAAAGGAAGSDQFEVGPFGWAQVTPNGQPWAIPGAPYTAHLVSTNGVAVVAERVASEAKPASGHGLGALLGLSAGGRQWALPGGPPHKLGERAARGQVELFNPGPLPATVALGSLADGKLVLWPGAGVLTVGVGQRAAVAVPISAAGRALVLSSSEPVLVEQDTFTPVPHWGVNLAPAVELVGGPA